MPSVSKKQQKFMGIVRAIQKGEQPASKFSKSAQKAAKKMKKSSVKKYAKTKHDDLPNKVKEDRDYKDEYKKFQSSTKAKKYRAELNKYNRQKGTYGNGDGKDASHKGGKIVGFESQSKNRGRAEKSRLRKEINDYVGNVLDEVVNEAGMELKKLEDAIKMFKKKIQKQGRVTNARDEEHLERLMKVYNDMGGRKRFKENNESLNWLQEKCWKGYEKKGMKTMFGKRYPNCVKKKKSEGLDEAVYKLKRGSTNDDLDELDALLARAGFKGKPDFNKMTWSIKNKNPKIAKIIKSKGGKKIKESVNEKVNKSDLKYQLDMSLDNLGIGTKALIVMKPKGKDFFLKMKSYMYQDSMEAVLKDANKNLDSKLKIKDFKKTRMGTEFIIGEGTCGYGIDGKIGEEPAGPNLMKKIKKISKDKEKKKLLKSKIKEVKPIKLKGKTGMGKISHLGVPQPSKGVEKLFRIADKGFDKVGGVTVDGMSAKLFKQIYNKANDDIKNKLNKKSEKELVRIIGRMWDKFGKNVKIGSSL